VDVKLNLDQVNIELGNNGIFLKIYEPNGGAHVGDLRIGKAKVVWMKGKTSEANGKSISLTKFIEMLDDE